MALKAQVQEWEGGVDCQVQQVRPPWCLVLSLSTWASSCHIASLKYSPSSTASHMRRVTSRAFSESCRDTGVSPCRRESDYG